MGGFYRLWGGLRPELESWIWGIVGVFPGPSSKTALKRCRVGRSWGFKTGGPPSTGSSSGNNPDQTNGGEGDEMARKRRFEDDLEWEIWQ